MESKPIGTIFALGITFHWRAEHLIFYVGASYCITGQLADTLGLLNQAHDLSDAARGLGFPSVVATPYQFPSEGMHPGYGAHSGWCAIQVVVHF